MNIHNLILLNKSIEHKSTKIIQIALSILKLEYVYETHGNFQKSASSPSDIPKCIHAFIRMHQYRKVDK